MSKFKEGGWVYFLHREKGVILSRVESNAEEGYPLAIDGITFTKDGKNYDDNALPELIHATPENRVYLVGLFGENAVPELPVLGSDLTKAMIKRRDYLVNAWVSDTNDADARKNQNAHSVFVYDSCDDFFVCRNGVTWKHAVPFDARTGKEIINLDGEVADE